VNNVPLSLDNYLQALTNTPSDRSSLTVPTRAWKAWTQSGTRLSYGAQFVQASATPPRQVRIAYVAEGTAASSAGLRRGDTVVMVDGVSVDTSTTQGSAIVNEALNPTVAGSHRVVVSRQGVQQPEVTLAAGQVNFNPVPLVRVHTVGAAKVGYLLFNEHVLTAEAALIDAIASFKAQGVNDLVVDLRYNSGGYTYLASQLAFMIAGDATTFNKRFEQREYSDKRWMDSARPDATVGFFGTSCFYNANFLCTNRTPLPTLDLRRVWVLAGKGTCATSEAFISGLRGVDVDVRLIGGATCGQPYGVQGKDNCGVTVLPVAYRGMNHKGESIGNSGYAPTCPAADDMTRELGDLNEGMLTAALYNRGNNNACSIAAAQAKALAPEFKPLAHPARALRLTAE
jgi:carboxyl-terminal processing protease